MKIVQEPSNGEGSPYSNTGVVGNDFEQNILVNNGSLDGLYFGEQDY